MVSFGDKREWRLFGRIVAPGQDTHGGHSVCNICGKDMPKVWDTVCSRCGRTFCYIHSVEIDGLWVCTECAGMSEEEIIQKEIDHCKRETETLVSALERWRKLGVSRDGIEALEKKMTIQRERLEKLEKGGVDAILHT